jgi:acyl-CoA thioester hydrolase
MPYRHELRVRYAECDQQGVVFNANYMVYMDDATEVWMSSSVPSGRYQDLDWDYMMVRVAIEWQGSARTGDVLSVEVGIVRYGSTSFDVGYVASIGDRPVFKARAVCVSVDPNTYEKRPTPEHVKQALGDVVGWEVPG